MLRNVFVFKVQNELYIVPKIGPKSFGAFEKRIPEISSGDMRNAHQHLGSNNFTQSMLALLIT